MANILGFNISKNSVSSEKQRTYIDREYDDGAMPIQAGGIYGHYYDMSNGTNAMNDAKLINRYRQMAQEPECEIAIDEIVNEAVILDQNETPGLGGRVAEEEFLSQLRGEEIEEELVVERGPGDYDSENSKIDAITGATGTSTSFYSMINKEIDKIKKKPSSYVIKPGIKFLLYSELQDRYDLYTTSDNDTRYTDVLEWKEFIQPWIKAKRFYLKK